MANHDETWILAIISLNQVGDALKFNTAFEYAKPEVTPITQTKPWRKIW
ncbi:MAG: hypothetical protein WBP13_12505 [Methylophilaceae bacterium]